ncbi:MAG: hypothetical protein J0L81_08805 [Caulobacterales bacterium]|jgi:hypothetical protein|nr:hypothetical protein [Caulobacterales bacterium]
MASGISFIALLALAGALLHLAWHLMLATLIWAPSAAGALGAGWYITSWTADAGLGVAAAILAASVIRALITRGLAWLWWQTLGGITAR